MRTAGASSFWTSAIAKHPLAWCHSTLEIIRLPESRTLPLVPPTVPVALSAALALAISLGIARSISNPAGLELIACARSRAPSRSLLRPFDRKCSRKQRTPELVDGRWGTCVDPGDPGACPATTTTTTSATLPSPKKKRGISFASLPSPYRQQQHHHHQLGGRRHDRVSPGPLIAPPPAGPDLTIVGEVHGPGEGRPDEQGAPSRTRRCDQAPPPASTPSPTPATPQKLSVSDRKKLFESAMEEHLKPSPKPDKIFSFLSQDEVEKLKQEEEKKIATLTRDDLKSWARIDENEAFDDEDNVDQEHKRPNSRLSSRSGIPILQNVPNVVRTAKAERRLKEKMIQEGLLSDEDDESHLTPAEQRALRAEKRAAWRQARLKSLEQDALQAQLVIKKMSEMMDTSKTDTSKDHVDNRDLTTETYYSEKMDKLDKVPEVETLREKIISLELSNPGDEELEQHPDVGPTETSCVSCSESEDPSSSSALDTPSVELAPSEGFPGPTTTTTTTTPSTESKESPAGDEDDDDEPSGSGAAPDSGNGNGNGSATTTTNGAKKKKRKRSKRGRH